MNTTQLERYIFSNPIFQSYYGGVLSRDTLPIKRSVTPKIYIVNMQNSNQPGDHWIALWTGEIPEFFDSLAEKPSGEFESFLISIGPKYMYNCKRLQSSNSNVCGQHCLMYSYFKCHGNSFQDYLNLFDDDTVLNDLRASYFYELTI